MASFRAGRSLVRALLPELPLPQAGLRWERLPARGLQAEPLPAPLPVLRTAARKPQVAPPWPMRWGLPERAAHRVSRQAWVLSGKLQAVPPHRRCARPLTP